MNASLTQAAAAMTANARWQDVIAGNLAAASVPGFKRQEISFASIADAVSGAASRPMLRATAVTSFRPGELRPTGSPTDVALEGDGFFTIRLPDGSEAYTRDGEWHVNAEGVLVTKQGFPVLGETGPIQLDRDTSAPLTIGADGQIRQGAENKGALRIMAFNDPRLLTSASGGCFLARDPKLAGGPVATPLVRQGFLEGANTSAVMEMAGLLSAMRAFEASQRIVQAQDERMGRAIQEIANPV
ncbi:MAG: flagellar hook-basal body protein [Verrucomicrobiota bacterium]